MLPTRRALIALLVGVVLVNTAMVGVSAAATLIVADALSAMWSGVPNAAGVLGTAIGAFGLGRLMARHGSRVGLITSYVVACVGACLAFVAVVSGALVVLVAGMLLLGIGNAGAQLSRYAAAGLYRPEQRGSVVGLVVWGGTVGAIVGPNLIAPVANLAGRWGLPPLAGIYLVALLAMLGAGVAASCLRGGERWRHAEPAPARLPLHRVTQTELALAITAMVASNFTMVAVMTMTPVYVQMHGQGLHILGAIISAHMIGMFALSPLTGRLADVRGGGTAIAYGIGALLAAMLLAGLAPADDMASVSFAMFLLGFGWNLSWVGGSSILTRGLQRAAHMQLQGDVDAVVWGSSTVASLVSGGVLATGGFGLLAAGGAAVALLPLVPTVLLRARSRMHWQEGETS